MPTYLLSVHHPDPTEPPAEEGAASDDDLAAVFAAVDDFNADLRAHDQWVFAGGLLPAGTARTARLVEDGARAVVTDGPYLESKEHLGGFWVVRAAADAIDDIAARAAMACRLDVEVRAFEQAVDDDLAASAR